MNSFCSRTTIIQVIHLATGFARSLILFIVKKVTFLERSFFFFIRIFMQTRVLNLASVLA